MRDKKEFIKSIIDDAKSSILNKVDKIPENWEGWEIRQYISDYISENCNYKYMDKKRMKEYKNDRIINNL